MTNTANELFIKNDEKINPIFIRANSHILFKNQESFKTTDSSLNELILKDCWKKTFKAELVKNNSDSWTHIRFNSPYDMSLFLIRYGQ